MADGRYLNLILVTIDLGDLCLYGECFLIFFFFTVSLRRSPYPQPGLGVLFLFGHLSAHNYLVISLCITQPVACLALGFGFSLGSPSCISISLSFCQIRPFA